MTHHNEWAKIGATIDAARKPHKQPKPWPSYAIADLKRHMSGMPDTDLFVRDEEALF